ncbi:hypothetical protein [Microbacterium sp. SORGH_AS_0888]|uniref:hypothetical protein n=1 Tax=Microbacterium sp. SORGH_AS_0888 TaxID=3041791 RepID=UPI0027895D0B|nr:hypothetical protein [Microbacterium sp. SORGH_AS_0888]MDQ1130788.1 hypothetical protein [Microbacterium sp. SORGH_AS_0888]
MFIRKVSAPIVILLSAALLLSGCGGSKDVTCGDYKKMSSNDQKSAIKSYYAAKGENNPSNGKILLTQQSAKLYCATAGHDSDPISKIDGN